MKNSKFDQNRVKTITDQDKQPQDSLRFNDLSDLSMLFHRYSPKQNHSEYQLDKSVIEQSDQESRILPPQSSIYNLKKTDDSSRLKNLLIQATQILDNLEQEPSNIDILELNVSGKTDGFTLRRSLLCSIQGSKLSKMFAPENQNSLEWFQGKIFLDRDPKLFECVVECLRNKTAANTENYNQKEAQEIKHWLQSKELEYGPNAIHLSTIFESTPHVIVHDKAMYQWLKLGSFNLLDLIDKAIINKQALEAETNIITDGRLRQNNLGISFLSQGQHDEDGHLNGLGRKMFQDSQIQEGEFKDDKMDGYGRTIFDGSLYVYYEGYHSNHLRHGRGTLYYSNGKTDKGVWNMGVLEQEEE